MGARRKGKLSSRTTREEELSSEHRPIGGEAHCTTPGIQRQCGDAQGRPWQCPLGYCPLSNKVCHKSNQRPAKQDMRGLLT